MDVNRLSVLYTISFTDPRLIPNRDTDFCVYFALETAGAKSLSTDLALFIRTLGRKLAMWSVVDDPDRLNPGDASHPKLQDIAYSWDGVACAYGVLQFSACPVPTLNIRRMFHQTSLICNPHCHTHRYEYFTSGIFSDLDHGSILQMFGEIEVCAQYVHSSRLLRITNSYIPFHSTLGNCAKITHSLSMTRITLGVFHFETQYLDRLSAFVIRTYTQRCGEKNYFLMTTSSTFLNDGLYLSVDIYKTIRRTRQTPVVFRYPTQQQQRFSAPNARSV